MRWEMLEHPSPLDPLFDPKQKMMLETESTGRKTGLHLDAETQRLLDRPAANVGNLGLEFAVRGWRRWYLAATSLFLSKACEPALRPDLFRDMLSLSIVGTLTVFGYYTSKIGMQQELAFAILPGEYTGCTHPEHGAKK